MDTHVELKSESEEHCYGCGVGDRRYKCPGCGIRSCSVVCVKKHKEETGCHGNRSKTEYVSISDFTTSHLLSDYYFLEEAGRLVDSAHRGLVTMTRDGRFERQQRLQRVRKTARKRGISLQLLPAGMTRHCINTSITVWNRERKEWCIEWRLKLVFSNISQSYTEERISEDKTVCEILNKYLHPSLSEPLFRHRLKSYVGREVIVYLRGQSSELIELCQSDGLRQCLRDKTVVEFPEVHIHLSPPPSSDTLLSNQITAPPPPLPAVVHSSLTSLAVNYGTECSSSSSEDGD